MSAGSATSPFQHKLTFILNGDAYNKDIKIGENQVGNKHFLVTGELHLYGSSSKVWTRLAQMTKPGDSSIKVESA